MPASACSKFPPASTGALKSSLNFYLMTLPLPFALNPSKSASSYMYESTGWTKQTFSVVTVGGHGAMPPQLNLRDGPMCPLWGNFIKPEDRPGTHGRQLDWEGFVLHWFVSKVSRWTELTLCTFSMSKLRLSMEPPLPGWVALLWEKDWAPCTQHEAK